MIHVKYRWVSYNKTINSAGYFVIETLCYRSSCRPNKFYFVIFSLLCGGPIFLMQIFNFFVSTFWRPELLVAKRFVVGTFWRCNILPLKNKNLLLLYEGRASFSYKFCCKNICYRRLACNVVLCERVIDHLRKPDTLTSCLEGFWTQRRMSTCLFHSVAGLR